MSKDPCFRMSLKMDRADMSYKQVEYNMMILAKARAWFGDPKEEHIIEQEEVILWEMIIVCLVMEGWCV